MVLPFELKRVAIVLRHFPVVAGLRHLLPLITSFIRPSPFLSLLEACKLGSVPLLDWVWNASCTSSDDKVPGWSLLNFLRTDLHYYRWVFYESLEIAARRGDLEVVEWLFAHFSGCGAPFEVVEEAAKNGHLPVLKFLLVHDAGRQLEGGKSHTMVQFQQKYSSFPLIFAEHPGSYVSWGSHATLYAVENGHSDVAKWLNEHVPQRGDFERDASVVAALNGGDFELAKMLLLPGRGLLDYAAESSNPECIEWALDCGYLQRNLQRAEEATTVLAGTGRLDLVRRIMQAHSLHVDSELSQFWHESLRRAFERGDLPVIQWLTEQPAGRAFCTNLKQQQNRLDAVTIFCAGMEDRPDVMQFVYEQGLDDRYGEALLNSVRKGHLNTSKWLLDHFPASEQVADYCVLDETAKHGHLELMSFLQGLGPSVVPGFFSPLDPRSKWWRGDNGVESNGPEMMVGGLQGLKNELEGECWRCRLPTDAMDGAAANGHIGVVQWLHSHRDEGCTTSAIDEAAANGHLEVVQWLYLNRSEGCTTKAVDYAASGNHFAVVEWLIANTPIGYTSDSINGAARTGNLELIKLLYENQPDCCTTEALEIALNFGQLRAAAWLSELYPNFVPTLFSVTRFKVDNNFEKVLYLHVQYPGIFPPGYMELKPGRFVSLRFRPHQVKAVQKDVIRAWLKEKYPAPEAAT